MSLAELKSAMLLNAKNLIGWKSDRKVVVFSVDDYGNVRLDSKEARLRMNRKGLKIHSRFDALDTLETREDLEALFEVLTSVKDRNGRNAVITAFAVPCNINFEKMAEDGYRKYHYEPLTDTYRKLSALYPGSYDGAWELWKEGMALGLMVPQFHGREHLNLKVLDEKLENRDRHLLIALENRSFTSISSSGYDTISPMAAFDFWEFEENDRFHTIIGDGIHWFEKVYGYQPEHFTPPVYHAHPTLYPTLESYGIRYIDAALYTRIHQGEGRFTRTFNYTGKRVGDNLRVMVRNVVFEPSMKRNVDWPAYAMKQVEAAFRWNRPAVISSHRVNFCGHIDEENRRNGLSELKVLLNGITRRWPDVEFMAANELGGLLRGGSGIISRRETRPDTVLSGQ